VWFARFIEDARAAGVRFNPEPATVNALAYLAATSRVDYLNAAAHILYATKALVRVVPEIKVMQAAAVKPEPREPIEVRIVSMPSRESKTFVERDPEDSGDPQYHAHRGGLLKTKPVDLPGHGSAGPWRGSSGASLLGKIDAATPQGLI
jgi:hypothetical protein